MADQDSSARSAIAGPGVDASRVYSGEEERRLFSNLRKLVAAAYDGEFLDGPPSAELLARLHLRLFGGVRQHAGRMRSDDYGSEYLTFGPNRSNHRSTVVTEISRIFGHVERAVQSFTDNRDAAEYEESAIKLVAWVQAEIIKVHPFEDGNGRSTRVLCDALLMYLGLRPIPIEAVKEEYNACLNEYFRNGNIAPLCDLLIRTYPLE